MENVEKKKRGGQLGNKGGRPRKFRPGTVMKTISVPIEDAELLKLITIEIHKESAVGIAISKLLD